VPRKFGILPRVRQCKAFKYSNLRRQEHCARYIHFFGILPPECQGDKDERAKGFRAMALPRRMVIATGSLGSFGPWILHQAFRPNL
jgi:hypothetical protein